MGKGRILIVDDDKALVKALSGFLCEEGFNVSSTADGREALTLVRTVAPAVVLLDVWLPGMDGVETLQALQAMHADVEVIVMSGHGNIATAVHMTKLGAFDYLEKPLSLSGVFAVIKRALEHRERRHKADVQEPVPSQVAVLSPDSPLLSLTYCQEAPSISPPPTCDCWRDTAPKQAFGHFRQRTLCRSVVLYGRGLQSGLKTGMILSPMPPYSGILFRNITTGQTMPASVDFIESTDFCTSLKQGCLTARTVEHLMSALHAYRITNVLIKISDEVPIMDGSADAFCHFIEAAGIAEQDAIMEEFIVDRCYAVGQVRTDTKFILVKPYDGFRVTYRLDYPSPLGVQEFSYEHTDSTSYRREIAPARTFAFVKEVEKMQELGLIQGGRLTNVVLIGEEKVVNSTPLRFPDECVRHKILDIIGDFYLLGRIVRGHVHANMTGHTENAALVKQLRAVMLHPRGY
jgi:UDP-3-O-[3-hydroxymyristoyl] N-acetylglucosamine deacetylase